MNSVNKPIYPLIPPQEMIQYMLKYSFFHKQVTQIPDSIIVSEQIDFDLKDGNLHNVKYLRGCDGNLQAVGRLLEGMSAEKAVEILDGVNCHGRGTSCTDQLTRIIRQVLK